MWRAASSATAPDFTQAMARLSKLKKKAFDCMMKIDVSAWSRHAFNGRCKSDTLINNIAETFNGYIVEARDKPIITMLESIREALMVRGHTKRDEMKKYRGPICPSIQEKLEWNKLESKNCLSLWSGESKFTVKAFPNPYN